MLFTRAIPAAVVLAAVACSAEPPPSPAPPTSSTTLAPTTGSTTAVNIRLTTDGRVVNATLNDSAAARDFASLLPLTLELSDFHETERIADLPRRPATAGAPGSADPQVGDLAFYAPWGNLAIYYREAPARTAWSSSAAWRTAAPRCSPPPAGSPSNAETETTR